LTRAVNGTADWVDTVTGETYDAVGNFNGKFFEQEWPTLKGRIIDHMSKADFVPVDVSRFTDQQRQLVRDFVQSLATQRVFLVGERYGG
jgi:hypothetical protein